MLPGVTGPRPCLAVVRDGRIRTQSPILNSSTLSISAGSAFQPREAPGKPTLRMPSSSIHSTVPMLSCDCPCHPYLRAKCKIVSLYLERSQSHITAHCEKIQKRFFKPNTKKHSNNLPWLFYISFQADMLATIKRHHLENLISQNPCLTSTKGYDDLVNTLHTLHKTNTLVICSLPSKLGHFHTPSELHPVPNIKSVKQSNTTNWSKKNIRLSPMSEKKNTSSNCLIAILQILLKITEQTNTPISKG